RRGSRRGSRRTCRSCSRRDAGSASGTFGRSRWQVGWGTVRDVSTDLVERHRPRLEAAIAAIGDRGYWSSFAEDPRDYPEDAAAAGTAAFDAYRGSPFPIEQPATSMWAGEERSPYGLELGITYPVADADALLSSMTAAIPAWRDAGPEVRAAVCA